MTTLELVARGTCENHGGSYLSQSIVNDVWVLEMIVREEVELVQEVANIYAAKRVHLRKRQNAREPAHN